MLSLESRKRCMSRATCCSWPERHGRSGEPGTVCAKHQSALIKSKMRPTVRTELQLWLRYSRGSIGKEATPKFLLRIDSTPQQELAARQSGTNQPDMERRRVHKTFFRMSAVQSSFKPVNYRERTPEFRADAWRTFRPFSFGGRDISTPFRVFLRIEASRTRNPF